MHITFRIIGETLHNTIMRLHDVSFGTFLMRSSPLMARDASLEMTAKNVMDGWNYDFILLSIQLREVVKWKKKIYKLLKLLWIKNSSIWIFQLKSKQKERQASLFKSQKRTSQRELPSLKMIKDPNTLPKLKPDLIILKAQNQNQLTADPIKILPKMTKFK